MAVDAHTARPTRRAPVRVDAEGGPWSVSVAETPHDARSYSLYVKTPTHNLTLTRTANEIAELHHKLRDTLPGAKLPNLPIDPDTLPPPTKRKSKSAFLNTLSRLASPANKSRGTSRRIISDKVDTFKTLNRSSEDESSADLFSTSAQTPAIAQTNNNLTAIAAYLTVISNDPSLNVARVWKRFVRVRTDDLESVRVERAIKRVRSDLAAHVSPRTVPNSLAAALRALNGSSTATSSAVSVDTAETSTAATESDIRRKPSMDQVVEGDEKDDDDDVTVEENGTSDVHPISESPQTLEKALDDEAVPKEDEPTSPQTPVDSPANRIPRSKSADPDKATRMSRVYSNDDTGDDTAASSVTEDDSSISTTGERPRKPRRPSGPKKSQRKVVISDFEMLRVLGKGCAGKVLLVRHRATADLFALKAITKRHVLAHQELQHTLTEQAVLKRMAAEGKDPFVVKLWWSFHDKENLFLVMDFHPGGDLATQLARWGRLGRDRARFYAAEIVEGVEGLHAAGVIYRDLKPENILIAGDGHIVLTDFGLSKEFPRSAKNASSPSIAGSDFYSSVPGTPQPTTPPWMRNEDGKELGWPGHSVSRTDVTSTFCGTAEYLAPEVIQGLPYSYEVDWWSFGTMLYEMLTGITPFWANNHSDMYVRVLQDELQFPEDRAIDHDTKSLIRGLLQRNPSLRMSEPRIKKHPYFSMIDWSHVYYKRYIPPHIPPIDPDNAGDTQNFDDTFLDMEPIIDDAIDVERSDTDREATDNDRTDDEINTTPSQSRSSSMHARPRAADEMSVDVFDGYSFKGRHSVIIDDEGEGSGGEDEEEPQLDVDLTDDLGQVTSAPPEMQPDAGVDETEDEQGEPKTPEARPASLPEIADEMLDEDDASIKLRGEAPSGTPRTSADMQRPKVDTKDVIRDAQNIPTTGSPLVVSKTRPPAGVRTGKGRREKSGVTALDRYLSDTVDEDGGITEKDDEDDDWDFIEAVDGEDRNGAKGTSLFARGVVDRYRLAVFRKASTPGGKPPRSFSGMSKASKAETVGTSSPSPSEKLRRGRTPLTFRKNPREFLRPKSPHTSGTSKSLKHAASSSTAPTSPAPSAAMLTPSTSVGGTIGHSLKSKESAVSMGVQSNASDDLSGQRDISPSPANGNAKETQDNTLKGNPPTTADAETHKPNKLKKYKEGAEKVLSLFQTPRQQA